MPDDATLDEILETTRAPVPGMNAELRWAFICDIAQATYPMEEIARRYGFPDGREMVDYIKGDASLIRDIKARRAYWNSDVGLQDKLRTLYGHTLQHAGIANARLMLDTTQKPELRMDMARLHARIAGVDGLPATRDGAGFGGQAGTRFFLQINLPGQPEKPLIDVLTPDTIEE